MNSDMKEGEGGGERVVTFRTLKTDSAHTRLLLRLLLWVLLLLLQLLQLLLLLAPSLR